MSTEKEESDIRNYNNEIMLILNLEKVKQRAVVRKNSLRILSVRMEMGEIFPIQFPLRLF